MKTRTFIGMTLMLMTLVGMTACDNENEDNPGSDKSSPTELLYGEWWLVGWNDGGTWFEVDTNYVCHQHLSIEIPKEGYVMGYSIVNDIFIGLLTLNGNEMIFGGDMRGGMTEVGCSLMENNFFENHICDIKAYQLDGKQLRLYYTDKDYFVFTKDFDDSEEFRYEWKNGPSDSFVGEVTAINDNEVEVKIIQAPPYAIYYFRTMPPMGNHEICHFATSDLQGTTLKIGDKVTFRIVKFKQLKNEEVREYQLVIQTDYYYYDAYTGKKIPLTLNENKLVVSIPIDCDEISKRIRANVQALFWTQDNSFDFFFITRSDFEKLTALDFWEEDAKSVIITPSYIKDDDRGEFYREVFSTPYVCITLKKEEDIDLLTPYLEKYRIKIAWQSPWTPLAVDLSLTPDSEKGPLEIANEMFESGDFASSIPDFALAGSGASETNAIRPRDWRRNW